MYFRVVITFFLIGVLIGIPMNNTQAYVEKIDCMTAFESDVCLRWPHQMINYNINGTETMWHEEAIDRAFQSWEDATNGMFYFTKTNETLSDIHVNVRSDIENVCLLQLAAGCAWVASSKGDIKKVTLWIKDKSCTVGWKMNICINQPLWLFHSTTQHEIGHALGLAHAEDDNMKFPIDIMYFEGIKDKAITEQDIEKLRDMYGYIKVVTP